MKIAVLGVGNVLRRDDGFGPSAVRRLEALYEFPDCVALRDLGTPGLDLASHLIGHDAVLFFDAARSDGAAPGTLRVFGRDEILARGPRAPRVTGHDGDIREALLLLDLAGRAPRHVSLIGVVPANLSSGAGLGPCVEAALGPACERALGVLAGWGVAAKLRREAGPFEAWWQEDEHRPAHHSRKLSGACAKSGETPAPRRAHANRRSS